LLRVEGRYQQLRPAVRKKGVGDDTVVAVVPGPSLSGGGRTLAFLALFWLSTTGASALDSLNVEGGLVILGSSGGAGSQLTQSIGATITIQSWGNFSWRTSLQLYSGWYGLEAGRPVPTEIENRDFLVLGAVADATFAGQISLGATIDIGAFVGLAAAIRLPIGLFGDVQSADAADYLYGAARFLYPETGAFLRWRLLDSSALVLTSNTLLPWFHLWDGENLPFFDQSVVFVRVGLEFAL
jgi:hypothetical protein